MNRRFYVFNSLDAVKQHISEVKTLRDLAQLRFDIESSGTNLALFKQGRNGVYAIDCYVTSPSFRHVFLTKDAFAQFGEISQNKADSYSVLEG